MQVLIVATIVAIVINELLYRVGSNHAIANRTKILIIAMLPILFITVFRLNTDPTEDTTYLFGSYYQFYEFAHLGGRRAFDLFNEPLSWGVLEVMAKMNIPYIICLGMLGAVYVLSFSVFIAKCSKNTSISLVLFLLTGLFSFSFSALRQAMGVIALLVAYGILLSKQKLSIHDWIKIVAVLTIGSLFHVTCFLMLPVFFIAKMNIKTSYFFTFMVVCLIGSPFIGGFLNSALSATKYAARLSSESFSFSFSYVLIGLAILLLMLLCYSRWQKKDHSASFSMRLTMIFVALMAASNYLIDPYRIFFLFAPFFIIVAPSVITAFEKGEKIIVTFLIVAMFAILFGITHASFTYESVLGCTSNALGWI